MRTKMDKMTTVNVIEYIELICKRYKENAKQIGKKREKSDNCRIRTCAGKAQQISSLSP